MFRGKNVVEKTNTRILCSITFYNIVWENMLKPRTGQATDDRQYGACALLSGGYRFSLYVTFIVFFTENSGYVNYSYVTLYVLYLSCYIECLCGVDDFDSIPIGSTEFSFLQSIKIRYIFFLSPMGTKCLSRK